MYSIENTDYGLKLTFSGTVTAQEMRRWAEEVPGACRRAGSSFGVFVDMRELKPLVPEAQDVMVKTQAGIKAAGLVRSCVILSSKILTMQFERLARESGIFEYERYVDAGSNPDFENLAMDWIKNGVDRIRRN